MKTGKTITELAMEIESRANQKRDFIVPSGELRMTPETQLAFGDSEVFPVNGICHAQIAAHLSIPKQYYDRMLTEAPELLSNNVNRWFKGNDDKRMLRTLAGTARALVSDRYRPLENEDLFMAVYPTFKERNLVPMSCEITEKRLYIKVVDHALQRELQAKGAYIGDGGHTIVDCVFPALTLSNSEVGMGSLSCLTGVFKRGCSNLATFDERSTRKYHIGGRQETSDSAYELMSDETKKLTDKALWAQVADVVKGAFDQAKFDSLVDKIEDTKTDKIKDAVKVVELTARKFAFTDAEGKSVLQHLIEGAELSRFGLHDAITRASQDIADYDRATELERAGGQVIELSRNQWSELVAA